MTKVKNNENKFWVVFFSLFSVVFISFLIVTAYRGKDEFAKNKLKQIKISGSYSYDGVTFNDLNDDNVMTPTSEDSIIIKGHFDQDIDTSMPIYFYLQGLRARILLNGEEILYHPEATQECWIYIDGYDIKKTDDIVIQLESERHILVNTYFIHFLDKIYNATRFELLSELMKKNVLSIIACVVRYVMNMP